MQKLVIIRGLPGSGKSKIAHEVYRRRGYWMVEYDHFFKDIVGDAKLPDHLLKKYRPRTKVKYDPSRKEEALDWLTEQMRRGLDSGNDVVVTGVLARTKDVRHLIARAGLPKQAIQVIVAHGGKGPNAKYHPSTVHAITRTWEDYYSESHKQLDPAQDKFFEGPRRLITFTPKPAVEEPEEVTEEVKTKPRVHIGMFKNLSAAERARLGK